MKKKGRNPSAIGFLLLAFFFLFRSAGCTPTSATVKAMSPTVTLPLVISSVTPTILLTPMPTNAPAQMPAYINSPTPVSTKLQPFFPLYVSTPEQSAANYRLKPWNEDNSAAMIEAALGTRSDYQTDDYGVDIAKRAFSAERLLRYPDSPHWFEWAWELTKIGPEGVPLPKMRPDQTYLGFLVEYLLNEEGVKLYSLPMALEDYGISVTDPIYDGTRAINNLYGDGKPAYLFKMLDYGMQVWAPDQAVFVAHQVDNKYQVDMLSDWSFSAYPTYFLEYSFQSGDDLNGNGYPELIIEERSNAHDFSGWVESNILKIYEWDPITRGLIQYQIRLGSRFSSYKNSGYEEQWKIGPRDVTGTCPIIITRYVLDKSSSRTDEGKQFVHPWSEIRQRLIPREGWFWKSTDLIASADEKTKQLLFGERNYLGAINYLHQLLANLTPVSLKYPHRHYAYFHYLLGLAYEMNGQPEQAAHTYYQIWQEAPDSLFGLAARFKLELKK